MAKTTNNKKQKSIEETLWESANNWNEGGLPIGLSLADLKVEHNSRPRNPKIADAIFMAGYIDTWGRGTLKIINTCREAGLPNLILKK